MTEEERKMDSTDKCRGDTTATARQMATSNNSNSTADGAENTGGADDNTVRERDSGAAWKSTKRRKGRRRWRSQRRERVYVT